MRVGGSRSVGGQTGKYSRGNRASTRALLALGMVVLMGMAALAGPAGLVGAASAQSAGNVDDCREIAESGSHTMTGDITSNGDGPCIEITASNVTLDGGGHELNVGDGGSTGISIGGFESNITDVEVENVDVSGFFDGITLDNAPDTSLTNVNVAGTGDSDFGIDVRGSPETVLDRIEVSGTNFGVLLDQSDRTEVVDGTVSDLGSIGLIVDGSHDASITRTEVSEVTDGGSERGIRVVNGNGLKAEGVTVSDVSGPGIYLSDTPVSTIRDSEVRNVDGAGIAHDPTYIAESVGEAPEQEQPPRDVSIVGTTVRNVDSGAEASFLTTGGILISGQGPGTASVEDVTIANTSGSGITALGAAEGEEIPEDERLHFDVRDSEIRNVELASERPLPLTAGILAVSTDGTYEDITVDDSAGSGVISVASSTTISGTDTYIGDNAEYGVVAPGITEANGDVSIEDATVANNGDRDLAAVGPNTLSATNVDVGESTASGTTIDVELDHASLNGVGGVPSAPNGQQSLGLFVDLQPETELIVAPEGPPEPEPQAVESQAEGEGPESSAELTIRHDDADLDGLQGSTLSLHRHDGDDWTEIASGNSATITSFSTFGLFAEPEPTPEPTEQSSDDSDTPAPEPAFEIGDVDADDEVEPGEEFTISVVVENNGDGGGIHDATLEGDDGSIDSQEVFVGPGESQTVTFTHSFDEEGEQRLTASNQTAVTVNVASQDDPAETPTDTATPTDAATPTDESGGAPTPDDDDGGGLPLVLGIGLALVIAAAVVVAALRTQG